MTVSHATIERMVDLLINGGVPVMEASERARNIAQIANLGEIDYKNIEEMLRPINNFRDGIANPSVREYVSQLVMCRIVTDADEGQYQFSKSTAYQMYCGMTKSEAIKALDNAR